MRRILLSFSSTLAISIHLNARTVPPAATVARVAQLTGQGAIPLLHYRNHTFGASFDPDLRLVFTMVGDRASKVTLIQGGGRFEGPRK